MGRLKKRFVCEVCGTTFPGWSGDTATNRYCSRKCSGRLCRLAGHDTYVVGRTSSGGCRACRQGASTRRYHADPEYRRRHLEQARLRLGNPLVRSRVNTLRSLRRIRDRRGRITEQIRELSAQLLVGQEVTNG